MREPEQIQLFEDTLTVRVPAEHKPTAEKLDRLRHEYEDEAQCIRAVELERLAQEARDGGA